MSQQTPTRAPLRDTTYRIIPTRNLVIACPRCLLAGHENDANYCRRCGEHLREHDQP